LTFSLTKLSAIRAERVHRTSFKAIVIQTNQGGRSNEFGSNEYDT
jgi:hypothetical protein